MQVRRGRQSVGPRFKPRSRSRIQGSRREAWHLLRLRCTSIAGFTGSTALGNRSPRIEAGCSSALRSVHLCLVVRPRRLKRVKRFRRRLEMAIDLSRIRDSEFGRSHPLPLGEGRGEGLSVLTVINLGTLNSLPGVGRYPPAVWSFPCDPGILLPRGESRLLRPTIGN